jgi:SPP1 gp7 family putative phage head morphogenesis protein
MTISLEPLTMQAAADFWKDKIKLGPAEFKKLSDEAKIRAFGISGIAKGDELTTVFNSLQAAIDKGISYGDFKKECADIFARRGWTGKREWRVQNIFRTNIQTAYNSGRYQTQKDNADAFPYLQYNAVNDRRTRPTHRALDGKVFPINHPFWDTWYPPNGYRCRCSTLSLTEGQIKRMGMPVETADPTDTPVEIADPRTGAKMTVQQLLPDPGFAQHPGKVVWGGMVDDGARYNFKQMEGLAGPADYRLRALSNIKAAGIAGLDETALLAAGKDAAYYREEFVKRYGDETLVKDAVGEPVILSLRSFLVDKTPGAKETWRFAKDGHGEAIPLLKEMIENPFEIWLTPQQDEKSGRIRLARRYVGLWKTEDKTRVAGLAVFEVADGVFQGVTSFLPTKGGEVDLGYAERQRVGLLLYPKR